MKRINLLPTERKAANTVHENKYLRLTVALFVLFIAVLAWQMTVILRYNYQISTQKENIKTLLKESKKNQAVYGELSKQKTSMTQRKEQIFQRVSLLQEARRRSYDSTDVLLHFSDVVPDAVWLKELVLQETTLMISGTTLNNQDVTEFMMRLDQSKDFRQTAFNYMQKAKSDDRELVDFQLKSQIRINR